MDVYLVRHTAVATTDVCYGWDDVPLRDGYLQDIAESTRQLTALLAGRTDPSPPVLYSSPSTRCTLLANHLTERLAALHGSPGISPLIDTRLREMHFGEWEGVRWDDIPREAIDAWASDPLGYRPPGGESGLALLERWNTFCENVLHPQIGRTPACIVVTHGGPIRCALNAAARGLPEDLLGHHADVGTVTKLRLLALRDDPPSWRMG